MSRRIDWIEDAVKIAATIGVILLICSVIYWVILIHMEVFEILFGNGWLYFAFLIAGFILSIINIPLYKTAELDVIYVNVGGCILPLLLTGYLLLYKLWDTLNPLMFVAATLVVILVARLTSWYEKGRGVLGIGLFTYLSAAFLALFFPFYGNIPIGDLLLFKLAIGYTIATIGVIVGTDLLHLGMIGRDGKWGDELSIGGAGIKDGVWLAGLNTMFLILLFHHLFGW